MNKTYLLLCLLVVLICSCTSSPKSHEAEVGAPLEKETIESSSFTYKVDLENSILGWTGTKLTGRHIGKIALKEGLVHIKDDKIIGGNFVFDMKEISIDDLKGELQTKLYNHLQSDDFFAVSQYPIALFELVDVGIWEKDSTITDVDPEFALEEPSHRILGNLTLRGKTLGVSFPAKIIITDTTFKALSKFNIDRTRWGVSYNSESSVDVIAKDNLIRDEVNITLNLLAKK